jgi:S-DNA-T family DNA segregation ATPase FtsK/SpoIIIE
MTTAAHHPPTADRPQLSLVPDAPTPLEGTVVKHQESVKSRLAPSVTGALQRAQKRRLYIPQAVRGYRRLATRWYDGLQDDWPQMITSARAALKAAQGDVHEETKMRSLVRQRRSEYLLHKAKYSLKTGAWSAAGGFGGTVGVAYGGGVVELLLAGAAVAFGAYHGRSEGNASSSAAGQPVLTPGSVGEQELITALINAKIITNAQREETRIIGGIHPEGPGWAATVELPRGMEATDAAAKIGDLASSLRIKKQRIELKVDTSTDGHEGRFTLWVANSDNPYAGSKVYSQLIQAPRWDFWTNGVPLGTDARGRRTVLPLLWSSILLGGLQDYGKSYLARLIAAAAALDPHIRIVLISGKVSPDWLPLEQVADKYIVGADPATIRQVIRVLDETILDMQKVGDQLTQMYREDPAKCPEGKLTRELAQRPGMSPTLFIVEELQELLDAADLLKVKTSEDEDGEGARARSAKDVMVESMARFVRVTRFVGGMGLFITQRPDADSVPTKLREVCVKRACFRVKGDKSARMILGDDAVASGAAPHMLTEASKGVFVLDQGAESGHTTQRGDVIDLPDFMEICRRGRQLRINAGTLTGYAAGLGQADTPVSEAQVVIDAIDLMDKAGVDRMRTEPLVEALRGYDPERYGDLTPDELKTLMREAGAGAPVTLGAIDGLTNPRGFKRRDLDRLV